MRALQFLGDRRAAVREMTDPVPGIGEVRVALRASAICGSDLHGYRSTEAARSAAGLLDVVPGHEPAGVVDSFGEGVTNVNVGDRVAVYHYRGCGYCEQCRGGRLMWCADRRGYGGAVDGSDADFLITDARNCLPLPDDISFTTAALLMCVGGTAFAALGKLRPAAGDTLAISGLGPVGLATLRFARALGVRVIGVDRSQKRLQLASEFGAEAVVDAGTEDVAAAVRAWTGRAGVSTALETSGFTSARAAIVAGAGRGGRVAFVGFGDAEPALNPADLIDRQLTLFGSFVFPLDTFDPLVRFVRTHGETLEEIVTDRVTLQDVPAVMPAVDRSETGKVVIVWEDRGVPA